MKSKAIGAVLALGISLVALLLLWPKEDSPSNTGVSTNNNKRANSSRLKLMVKTKETLKKNGTGKASSKNPKTNLSDSEADAKELLGQELRDAVKNGTMSKKKAIQIWRDKTGGRHPWEGMKKSWGKGKGKGNGKRKAAVANWLRENAVYIESRTLTVKGRLVDLNEQAIADAQVSILPMAELSKPPRMGTTIEGVSNEEGRFQLSANGHQFRLFIRSPDGIESKNLLIPLSDSNEVDLGDIQLGRAYRVQGSVRNPEGDSVSGAAVKVYSPADYQRLVAAENVAYVSQNIRAIAESQSSPAGEFDFQLARGAYVIVASVAELRPSKALAITVADRPVLSQQLTLRAPRTLSILVNDQNDRGLADVTIKLTPFGLLYRDGNPIIAEVTTDGEGRANLDKLLFRRYQIVADAEGYARILQELQFTEDQTTQEKKLTIFTGAQVTGKILSKNSGNPVAATLVCSGALPDGRPDMQRLLEKSPVNEDGSFAYQRVAPGNYILTVYSQAHSQLALPFTVGADQSIVDLGNVELISLGAVTMTVILGDGQCPSSGTVQIRQLDSNSVQTGEIEEGGSASFEGVPLSPAVVTVLDKSGQILGFQDIDFSSETNPTVRLLPATATFTGQFQTSTGAGQAGTLHLIRRGGKVPPLVVTAEETGAISASDLPPGVYDVYLPPAPTVAQPGFSSQTLGARLGELRLESDKTVDKKFQAPASTPSTDGE